MKKEEIRTLLNRLYEKHKKSIKETFKKFHDIYRQRNDTTLYKEFIFCLLTPQAKPENAWETVLRLEKKRLLFKGTKEEISNELNTVRFKFMKAEYIIYAQKNFLKEKRFLLTQIIYSNIDDYAKRERLKSNVKGMGYKEASHFLRNIGLGEKMAILDRHILTALNEFNVIENIPKSLTKKIYLSIEKKMLDFSLFINIPISHLDMLLWLNKTNRFFK